MPTFSITSSDTLTLLGRVFNDLADGDSSAITFPNDLVSVKTGKNGNTIYSGNETGKNANMTLRVMRGSSDDRFLQGKLSEQQRGLSDFSLVTGEFVKRLGDGDGGIIRDVYTMLGGIFLRKVEGKENVEGDTEQGVAVYNMLFADAKRSQQ